MLKALRRLGDRKRLADGLFAGLAARAREPVFFLELGVPDTIDGRFDLLALHAWLVLERLAAERDLSQTLTDIIFVQFDESLRQLGVGDIGIGHRVKKMADAFYGRLKAYGGDEARAGEAGRVATYALAARDRLSGCELTGLDFGPLPLEAHAS
jgi:cytochrome b pre-mRNA-processing protein 3